MTLDANAAVSRTARSRRLARFAAAGVAGLMAFAGPAAATDAPPGPSPSANPDLATSCGLDFVMILDRSGSVSSNDADDTVRGAATAFLDALADTGSTVSLVSFADTASVDAAPTPLTSGDNLEKLHSVVNEMQFKGYTNWDDALLKAQSQFKSFPAGAPPLVIMVTDGVPNRWINDQNSQVEGKGAQLNQTALDQAVAQADEIKANGTHMFALGVEGDLGLEESSLQDISGLDEWTGGDIATADWTKVQGFDKLSGALQNLATDLCGGSVVVEKLLDGLHTAGWTFSATGATPETAATGDDGRVTFEWDSVQAVDTVITELSQPDVVLDGAACLKGDDPVGTFADGAMHLTVGPEDIIKCRFDNRTVKPADPEVPPAPEPEVPQAPEPGFEPTSVEPAQVPDAGGSVPGTDVDTEDKGSDVLGQDVYQPSGATLPRTGVTVLPLVGLGGGLLALGQVLRAARRRQR